jgi:transcription initiation factor TFIID subunit 11
VVNATVSQSVPQNVSTAVKAVAKLFAGEIIEAARTVQGEWIAAGEEQTDLPKPKPVIQAPPVDNNPKTSEEGKENGDQEIQDREKEEREKAEKEKKAVEDDIRRGPLRPDHLREAWRRYRFTGESRGVGVQQLWHAQQNNGVERFSTKTGKRLFK